MATADITTIISSVGFPIVACCAMGWFINSTFKEFQSTMVENNTLLNNLLVFLKGEDEKNA